MQVTFFMIPNPESVNKRMLTQSHPENANSAALLGSPSKSRVENTWKGRSPNSHLWLLAELSPSLA